MSAPWTASLFLKINALVGRFPLVDRMMIFCAHYLMWGLAAIMFFAWVKEGSIHPLAWQVALMWIVAFALSNAIAVWWPHPRPIRVQQGITVLIKTLGTWKSFPSDHTIAATLLAYAAAMTFQSTVHVALYVCACASIAIGRVWVGVHYPRDIIGGFLLATGIFFLFV